MLFGPRLNTVFASRWKAVLWSLGILLTAYCSVPSPDSGKIAGHAVPPDAEASAPDAPAPPGHRNPWAK